jgi:hypothetical protein
MNIRFLNGFLEIEYEPVMKILDGKDWKTVEWKKIKELL